MLKGVGLILVSGWIFASTIAQASDACPRVPALSRYRDALPLEVSCHQATREQHGFEGKLWLLASRSVNTASTSLKLIQNTPNSSYRHLGYSGFEFPARWEAEGLPSTATSQTPQTVLGVNGNFFGGTTSLASWRIENGHLQTIHPPRVRAARGPGQPRFGTFVFLGANGEWAMLRRRMDQPFQVELPQNWGPVSGVGFELNMPLLRVRDRQTQARPDYDCKALEPSSQRFRLRGCDLRPRTVLCLEDASVHSSSPSDETGVGHAWLLGKGRVSEIANGLASRAAPFPNCRHAFNLDGGGSTQLFLGHLAPNSQNSSTPTYLWQPLYGARPNTRAPEPQLPASSGPFYTRPVDHWIGYSK